MNEILLVAIIFIQGATLGQFETTYEVVGRFPTARACKKELAKAESQERFLRFVCVPVSKD